MHFNALFICLLIITHQVGAQEVDFDREFPIPDDELYAPLIGENGELPSDFEGKNVINSQNSPDVEAEFERFYQENASAIEEMREPVYAEPTQALGYVPETKRPAPLEHNNIEIPQNATSFSVESLPTTSASRETEEQSTQQNTITVEQLDALEKTVESMELTIESIIERGLDETSGEENIDARPLDEVPNLTVKTEQDIESVGLLTAENGFREDAFTHMTGAEASAFLDSIQNSNIQSRVLRDLVVKLLTTQTQPPKYEDEQIRQSWLATRINVLQTFGEYRKSNLLLSKAGIGENNVNQYNGLAQFWVQSELLEGNHGKVCPFVRNNILNSGDIFWRQALNVCQLLSGDEKGLKLSLSMVTEQSRRADPLLYQLFDAVQGEAESPLLRPNEKLNPLHASIYVFAPDMLTPQVIQFLPDTSLRKIAKNVALTDSLRIQAAESLVERFDFVDDIALLALLYDKVEFEKQVVSSAGVSKFAEEELDGSIARALLWQASKVSGLASTRALTLKDYWKRAYKDNLYILAARIKPEIRHIQANSNLAWLAPQVIKHSLILGDTEHAETWWKYLQTNRSLSKELREQKDKLSLLMAFSTGHVNEKSFNNWLETLGFDDNKHRNQIKRYVSLLEASEKDFPGNVWEKLESSSYNDFQATGVEMNALWLRLLGNALENQDMVNSLKLLVEPFKENSIQDLGNQTLSNTITSFRFLGMTEVADKLIYEILIDTKSIQ